MSEYSTGTSGDRNVRHIYTGSRPTILNYEKALQNRYASWEQELNDRENAVREKERQLMLDED